VNCEIKRKETKNKINMITKIQLNDMGKLVYDELLVAIKNTKFNVDDNAKQNYPNGQWKMEEHLLSIHEDGSGLFPQEPIDKLGQSMEEFLTLWAKNHNNVKVLSYIDVDGPYQSYQLCSLALNGDHPHAIWIIKLQLLE